MFKLNGIVSVIINCCLIGSVFAQPFTIQAPDKPQKKSMSPVFPKVKVMTPDNFKSEVTIMNKQTQDGLNKAINSLLPKKPPTGTPSPAPSDTQQSSTPKKPQSPVDASPSDTAPPPSAAPSAPPTPPPAAPMPQADAAPPPSESSAPPAQPAKPYTGFGDSGSNNNSNSGGENSSDGWNVKY